MSVKQVSVYDGSSWVTEDIGANASNITLGSKIGGTTNLQTALTRFLPASTITKSKVIITNSDGKLAASDFAVSDLNNLANIPSDIQAQIDAEKTAREALSARMDNLVNNVVDTETVLWEGSLAGSGATATLSDDIANYDYIDFYIDAGGLGEIKTVPSGQDVIVFRALNLDNAGTSGDMKTYEIDISLATTTITINFSVEWEWTGSSSTNATIRRQASGSGIMIKKVVGRKLAENTEVNDIRIGYDGTEYQNAGNAIRNQIDDIHDEVGNLSALQTTEKSNLVSAINEIASIESSGVPEQTRIKIDKLYDNSYMNLGTTIELNTDLNTLTTVGKYSARTTTVSSLLNCPTIVGFSMYVEIFTTSGKKQTIIDNNGDVYTRINIANNTTSWKAWSKQPTKNYISGLSQLSLESLTHIGQDSVYYDGKIFQFETNNKNVQVYDFNTKQKITQFTLAGNDVPHVGVVSFGNKQNSSDTYPLLYATGSDGIAEDSSTLPWGTCFVYKIENDYTNTLLQKISIGFINDAIWKGDLIYSDDHTAQGVIKYGNFIIDTDRNKLLVFTCRRNADNHKMIRIFEFEIPDISNSNIILQESDIQEIYDIPFYPYPQGAVYHNGILYIANGSDDKVANSSGLNLISTNNFKQIGRVELSKITKEPQAVVVVNNSIYVGYGVGETANGRFIKINNEIPYLSNLGDFNKLNTFDMTFADALNRIDNYTNQHLITQLGKPIESGSDLNNFTINGIYTVQTAAIANTILNMPETNSGKLIVIPITLASAGYKRQIFISNYNENIYSRSIRGINDGWSSWQAICGRIIRNQINNIHDEVGNLSELETTAKTDLVSAINELAIKTMGYVIPEMYGAVGDGVTDDSSAIQTAINQAAALQLPLVITKNYYLASTITVPDRCSVIAYNAHEYAPRFIVSDDIGVAFHCTGVRHWFENIAVYTTTRHYVNYIAFQFDGDSAGNINSVIKNISIIGAEKGVLCKGRNLKIIDGIFSHCRYGIHIDIPSELVGVRGIVIDGVRFHGIGEEIDPDTNIEMIASGECSSILLDADVQSSVTQQCDVQILNCLSDQSGTFIKGSAQQCLVSGCYIIHFRQPAFVIKGATSEVVHAGGAGSWNITGCFIYGVYGTDGAGTEHSEFPDYAISIENYGRINFISNVIGRQKRVLYANKGTNISFLSNSFIYIAETPYVIMTALNSELTFIGNTSEMSSATLLSDSQTLSTNVSCQANNNIINRIADGYKNVISFNSGTVVSEIANYNHFFIRRTDRAHMHEINVMIGDSGANPYVYCASTPCINDDGSIDFITIDLDYTVKYMRRAVDGTVTELSIPLRMLVKNE